MKPKLIFDLSGMQNSKFLQFVSKMSRGELIIDDNQVKPNSLSPSDNWASEYQQQYSNGGRPWADEFVSHETRWILLFPSSTPQSDNQLGVGVFMNSFMSGYVSIYVFVLFSLFIDAKKSERIECHQE